MARTRSHDTDNSKKLSDADVSERLHVVPNRFENLSVVQRVAEDENSLGASEGLEELRPYQVDDGIRVVRICSDREPLRELLFVQTGRLLLHACVRDADHDVTAVAQVSQASTPALSGQTIGSRFSVPDR